MITCDGGCPDHHKGDEPDPACTVGQCAGVGGYVGDTPGHGVGGTGNFTGKGPNVVGAQRVAADQAAARRLAMLEKIVFISSHVGVAANDPDLQKLQQYWKWANQNFGDLDEAGKWRQICEGGDTPCDYRLKALFLEQGGLDWLSESKGHKLFAAGGDILVTARGLFAFRSPNAEHPPSEDATKRMGELPIGECGYDCSEIAEELFAAAGREGAIVRIEARSGEYGSTINVPEAGGSNTVQYTYHEVYMDGKYAYDPRLSPDPIPPW